MRFKKFVVQVIVAEQMENEAMDSIWLKKTYEIVEGKKKALESLERGYNEVKGYVENEIEGKQLD